MNILTDIDFWKFTAPIIGAAIAWHWNERRKRAWEEYEKKERNYQELIKSLKGFYASHSDAGRKTLKNQFIDQLNLCWLYSPDAVIKSGYTFLDSVHTDRKKSDTEKEAALGAFILEIRKDLLKRRITKSTSLLKTDFRNLTST
jgi:hypothetical protein